ncbi:MAG: TetR/AcrR family transcriptional regulator [Melioribacteraceae bacterium]|nr:TetR/AcrR family transcriptional regulator [Melioribacteraceae bacterium]MCO6472606.1 TetR/AcrR family transcriptional regulator [Melioribacteraceae bacterium]MDD3559523.1 TetR/AcrR family transcriptional regulator [Melioribacteraceae bacterium]
MAQKKISENYDQKKELIIEAAEEQFAYFGYHKTTLEDIARKVGIKKNSIYYYFESKEALLNEIIQRYYKSKISAFESEAAKEKSTKQKLKLFLTILIAHTYNENKKYNITPHAFIEISRVIEESFKEFYDSAELYVTTIIEEGIRSSQLKRIDARDFARTILRYLQAIEVFEYSKIDKKYIDEQTVNKLKNTIDKLIDLVFDGIRK